MKAMRLADSGETTALVEENLPQPQPGRGELLIQVHAAGVTAKELLCDPTTHKKSGESRSCAIPGHEFSGVIAAVGKDTAGFDVGQEVYGMNDWFSDGATEEYCITQPTSIEPKPTGLTHIEAASVPIGALTAWHGLFDRAMLQAGARVLVHGGAGAVVSYAIRLARYHGADVVSTASAQNIAFVSGLGAEQVFDYQATRFDEKVSEIDVVFHTGGGVPLLRPWALLNPGGRIITIA